MSDSDQTLRENAMNGLFEVNLDVINSIPCYAHFIPNVAWASLDAALKLILNIDKSTKFL